MRGRVALRVCDCRTYMLYAGDLAQLRSELLLDKSELWHELLRDHEGIFTSCVSWTG